MPLVCNGRGAIRRIWRSGVPSTWRTGASNSLLQHDAEKNLENLIHHPTGNPEGTGMILCVPVRTRVLPAQRALCVNQYVF